MLKQFMINDKGLKLYKGIYNSNKMWDKTLSIWLADTQ